MQMRLLILSCLFSISALADSWTYQLKDEKLNGITLATYKDDQGLEHFKVGHFVGPKAIEKESVTKSEFSYLVEYGERLKKDLTFFPEAINCEKNLLVITNYTTKICYRVNTQARKDFFEWHDYVQNFILGKEEKENLILRRHLKKK